MTWQGPECSFGLLWQDTDSTHYLDSGGLMCLFLNLGIIICPKFFKFLRTSNEMIKMESTYMV